MSALKGHPKGLYLIFATSTAERFSYYGMRAIFILFRRKEFNDSRTKICTAQYNVQEYGKKEICDYHVFHQSVID